jgi:hypothetical protein
MFGAGCVFMLRLLSAYCVYDGIGHDVLRTV